MTKLVEQILATEMQQNDAGAKTIKDYLVKLLSELWREGEGFSGKRPFGNSGWEYELYTALAVGGFIDHEVVEYEDGEKEYDNFETKKADELIFEAISSL